MRSPPSTRQPPRAAGRGMAERKSPVHEAAERFGLPVFTPNRLKPEDEAERFAALGVDVGVVAAYGQILPKAFLDAPPDGCLNLHGSLLPRWRGAAPVARAIMAGDAETGVMVMRMEEGLDTGPVAMSERIAIAPDATAGEIGGDAGRARRRPHGAGARRAVARRSRLHAAGGGGRHLRQQARQCRDAHRLVAPGGARSTTTSAACRPFPAPGARPISARGRSASRCCARRLPRAPARPAPCSTTSSPSPAAPAPCA